MCSFTKTTTGPYLARCGAMAELLSGLPGLEFQPDGTRANEGDHGGVASIGDKNTKHVKKKRDSIDFAITSQ